MLMHVLLLVPVFCVNIIHIRCHLMLDFNFFWGGVSYILISMQTHTLENTLS